MISICAHFENGWDIPSIDIKTKIAYRRREWMMEQAGLSKGDTAMVMWPEPWLRHLSSPVF